MSEKAKPSALMEATSRVLIFREGGAHLGDRSVVPDVALVRKHISHVAKVPFFHVLFQWIQGVLGSDLMQQTKSNGSPCL